MMSNILMKIPIGDWVEEIIDWMNDNMEDFFDGIKNVLDFLITGLGDILGWIPFIVILLIVVIIAWWFVGKGMAVFSAIGLGLIYNLELWDDMVLTFSLVTIATLITVIVGLPLGIFMAKNEIANIIIRPILDFMQTMPAFVYLIPAVFFFSIGSVPGCIATIIFAMPPIVRLTNLGIRQVQPDVVEAARAFGATPSQLLFKVQLPLAIPTITAGLNQTIMLSLSMVVISAMIGADGLGKVVYQGISQMDIATGFEGGLAVVILAMLLDRITQHLASPKENSGRNFVKRFSNKNK